MAVHYVGNPGTTAQNNHNYFESLRMGRTGSNGKLLYVSSHYIVGLQGEVIQNIPEEEFSYCTNEANGYSISVETCHPDGTGKFNATTEQALTELVADICKRHGLDPLRDVVRHYDVTGKCCPKWYVNHPEAWEAFKERVASLMAEPSKWTVQVQHFTRREDADEVAGYLKALNFYCETRTDTANGKYVVDVFSFSDRVRADALAWVLNSQKYSVVRKTE